MDNDVTVKDNGVTVMAVMHHMLALFLASSGDLLHFRTTALRITLLHI